MHSESYQNKTFLTAREISTILRIPMNSVYYLTRQRGLTAVRVGKHLRYRKEDIERLVAGQKPVCVSSHCSNRRSDVRLNISKQASLRWLSHTDPISVELTNVSANGLRFHINNTKYSFTIDDAVTLSFSIEDFTGKEHIVTIPGRIIRVTQQDIAVKMRTMDPKNKQLIAAYVE